MRKIAIAIALCALAAGCTFTVHDPATGAVLAVCRDGLLTSFCDVHGTKDHTVVAGTSALGGATSIVSTSIVTGALVR